jgi:peptide/nickel transport system substrate-binding protein
MIRKGIAKYAGILALSVCVLFSCKTEPDISSLSVTIRLSGEPESLHPIFSKSLFATQIESLILIPIAEYDPIDLTLTPLLINTIPSAEKIEEGKHAGGKVFQLDFRSEAEWADGKPVTGLDYLFTIKSVYLPQYNTASWRGSFDFLSEIVVDPNDPKKVSVYVDSTYILDLDAAVNFNLYPAHIYDPENILGGFTLEELRDPNTTWTPAQDSLLKKFAVMYESPVYFRETVSGAGPYALDEWMTGEYIRLTRKQNWWGDKIKNPPLLLQAYPTEITYRIILDAAAAEAALKAGELDIMAEVPASSFKTLSSDPEWKDKLQFATPALMQVNYLELNNRDSILSDPKIRQALAYTIDYNGILTNVLQGYAERTVGPLHPDKNYYNNELKPIEQDINKSLALIKEAGWKDTNANGTPDKMIGGKREELKISITVTNREEGMAIANIVKENAKKAGFDIEIVLIDPSELQQVVRQNNFEIMPLRVRSYPSLDDPFPVWHSSSDKPGGSNRSGFHSDALDEAIEGIRTTSDPEARAQYYKKFQEILYESQPAIYLYVPLERIIASKRVQLVTSSRRPGYFENLIKPAGS